MSLYKLSDLDLVKNNIGKVIEQIEKEKTDKLVSTEVTTVATPTPTPPTTDEENESEYEPQEKEKEKEQPKLEDIMKIAKITLKFVADKQRKIYGGYAQNKVIAHKDKKDAFYKEDEIPDIDVYTPDPISDLVELCDILYNSGYTDVTGKEAMHKETYKIFAIGYNVIDLSYVPKNIYHNIPFIEIDKIRYVHPSFLMIDLYRMMTEPLYSSFRWEKIFPRLYLLQKHYPFPKVIGTIPVDKQNANASISDIVFVFVKNNKNMILFGDYAYNVYCRSDKPKTITHYGHYEMISTNYKQDTVDLINKLKSNGIQTTAIEYYPFFQFLGYSVEIIHNNKVIARIYDYNRRCTPTKMVDDIQIGSFDFVLLMEMVMSLKSKVNKQPDQKKIHDIKITNLISCREKYLTENKKTLLDNTLYQSFVPVCIGEGSDPRAEAKRYRKERKKKKKGMFVYKPIKKIESKWVFLNTSGNKISNPKNLKIKF